MKTNKLFMFLLLNCLNFVVVLSNFCFWNSGCPYKFFGSKTPYNSIRGDIRDSIIKLEGCEPISIWSLIRHGKNNPNDDFGKVVSKALSIKEDIIASYDNATSSLCAQDMENLRRWSLDRTMVEKPNQLTKEGYEEMYELGVRLKKAFRKLFKDLNKNSYTFSSAHGSVLSDSAIAFVKGLDFENALIGNSTIEHNLIAPYIDCDNYQKNVVQNSHTYDEVNVFENSPEYFVTKDRFQRRLGIEYALTNENLMIIYDLCSYDSSGLDNKFSPWCALFTTGDLTSMEYIEDIKQYYRNSYGNPINEVLGRVPLSDLLISFRSAKIKEGKKIKAYFTHDTMLNMAATALKLFEDPEPLTGKAKHPSRKWRSSRLSAFSTNFMAVLNRCKAENENDDFNVVFYWNEEPIRSICKHGVCSWQEFENKLNPFVNSSSAEIC